MHLLRNIEKRVPRIPTNLQLSPSCCNLLAMLLKKNPVSVQPDTFARHIGSIQCHCVPLKADVRGILVVCNRR